MIPTVATSLILLLIWSLSVSLPLQNFLVICHFPTLRKPQALPTSPWYSLTLKLSLYLFHFPLHCPLQRFPLQRGMNPSQAVPASRGPLKRKPKVWTEKCGPLKVEAQHVDTVSSPHGLWVTGLVCVQLGHSPVATSGHRLCLAAYLHSVPSPAFGNSTPVFPWGYSSATVSSLDETVLQGAISSLPKVQSGDPAKLMRLSLPRGYTLSGVMSWGSFILPTIPSELVY